MAGWVRNLVMLSVLGGWGLTIAAYLLKGQLPDAPLLGVPGAVYLAMSPSLLGRVRRAATAKAGDK